MPNLNNRCQYPEDQEAKQESPAQHCGLMLCDIYGRTGSTHSGTSSLINGKAVLSVLPNVKNFQILQSFQMLLTFISIQNYLKSNRDCIKIKNN